MSALTIYDRRERMLVRAADVLLGAAAGAARPFRRRPAAPSPRRILLLRLERIGDLVMALPAIHGVRALAPDARIDLVVGSWNAPIARAVPWVDRVRTLDARWLARSDDGAGLPALMRAASAWRRERYDLAINFEPDIRTNLLLAAAGARRTAGWTSGGGGALLDVRLDYDTSRHTSENATRLIATVFGRMPPDPPRPLLAVPEAARAAARARIGERAAGPLAGVHVSGGRLVKQWEPGRFAEVARRLAAERHATIVLTGGAADRPLVQALTDVLPAERTVDLVGVVDVLELAGVLECLDLLITGDTGPMHVAAAVGTPVVAVFGPSDPVRYAPSGPADRIVRAGLPCSPCNRIRKPPAHCVGHIPECLMAVSADQVYDAALSVLDRASGQRPVRHATA